MDWTGNKRSVFTTMGAIGHSTYEREQHDFYATDPMAIDRLAAKFEIPHKVWECACGAGHLSERLLQLGHEVYSSDLVERGYGKGGVDFLSFDAEKFMDEIGGGRILHHHKPALQVHDGVCAASIEIAARRWHCLFLLEDSSPGVKREI